MSSNLVKPGRKRLSSQKLNPLQIQFCEHYVSNGMKGAEAARAAGYKPSNAAQVARNLLATPKVAAYVSKRLTEIGDELSLKRHELLAIMRKVLQFNLMKYSRGKGSSHGKFSILIDEEYYDEIAEIIGDCVTKVTVQEKEETLENGETITSRKISIELMSKDRMFELAMRYAGMIKDEKGPTGVQVNIASGGVLNRLLDVIEGEEEEVAKRRAMVVDAEFIERTVEET